MDFVFVKDLAVRTISGVDAWKRPQTQPLAISIFINSNFRQASQTDHLRSSLNYDVISRTLSANLEQSRFRNMTHVAESVASGVLDMCNPGDWARIHVKKPRHLLRAESAELVITRQHGAAPSGPYDLVKINELGLVTIIGVNNIERLHRQNVLIDLVLYKPIGASESVEALYDAARVSETVAAHVENATYKTLEAFTESIAHIVVSLGIEKVKVSAAKPSALTWARCAGIEVMRTRDDYSEMLKLHEPENDAMFPQTPVDTTKTLHTVYLAFGTNVGDRLANIRTAKQLLKEHGVEVTRTSSVYRSAPMYVQDQQEFYNGVFAATTTLGPHELLKAIKQIEYDHLERQHGPRNGPRPMDIDILLYDDAVLNTPDLIVPHIDMLNRSFVLQPLVDVAAADLLHPLTAEPFSNHLAQIPASSSTQKSSALTRILPCGDKVLSFDKTHIMAILNATPDSFSDGGELSVESATAVAQQHIANGATILDVGGLSTRPGSQACTSAEEIERVVPIIKAVAPHGLVSIDTYRGDVARAALDAGASIINDVFAGQLDSSIFEVAAEYNAPLILSHSRGTPETMNGLAEYKDVVAEVGQELLAIVEQALTAGVGRSQLILDPGFGFAKTLQHNLELVRRFKELRQTAGLEGIPWLVGTSRKRFLGTLTGRENPADRDVATAATLGPLIAQGAAIVRVHDSRVAADTVAVVDAIYR